MTAIKKNWEALVAFLCVTMLLIITAVALWPAADYAQFAEDVTDLFLWRSRQYWFYSALGLLAGGLMLLVKEQHLYRSACVLFGILFAVLLVQPLVDARIYPKQYIWIGSFSFYSATLLPLMMPLLSRVDAKRRCDSTKTRVPMFLVALVPACLLLLQPHVKAAAALVGVFALFLFCFGSKRVRKYLIVALVLCVIAIVVFAADWGASPYPAYRLDVIFSRGQNAPYDWGYQRVTLDRIFSEAALWGDSGLVLQRDPAAWHMLHWGDHYLMIVLARMGWGVVAMAIVASVLFLVCVFRMAYKTRQSIFGKNLSLLTCLFFLMGTAVSLISVFLLEYSYCNLPFMFHNEELSVIAFVMFALIVRLYLDREKPSEICRLEEELVQEATRAAEPVVAEWDEDVVDIFSSGKYPSNILSNFYPHQFTFDGITCSSMESFLQSLKTWNPELQEKVCRLSGKEAKQFFQKRPENFLWLMTGNLYWQGEVYDRHSDEYQHLLNRAYLALLENKDFARALGDTEGRTLIHSIGKTSRSQTVLTEYEFMERLYLCRRLVESRKIKSGLS